MNAKATVTASMIYIGLLMLLSQGWLTSIQKTVQNLSGVKSNGPTIATGTTGQSLPYVAPGNASPSNGTGVASVYL